MERNGERVDEMLRKQGFVQSLSCLFMEHRERVEIGEFFRVD